MVFPLPLPGQVIRYAYLWWSEARKGRKDGVKDRPCSSVLTRITTAGRTVAYVLPITPTPPTELNQFTWPGPDLRPTVSGGYIYGYLPEKLIRLVLKQVKMSHLPNV